MFARNFKVTPSEPTPPPIAEGDYKQIEVGDLVRYYTPLTGHRCGIVRGRDTKKKKNKYHANDTAPLVVTIGVGAHRKAVVKREQLLEWRKVA